MNAYILDLIVDAGASYRPTVLLIKLYRALHECGLKEAKDITEKLHDKGKSVVTVNLLLDDMALGRVMYIIHDRREYNITSLKRVNACTSALTTSLSHYTESQS